MTTQPPPSVHVVPSLPTDHHFKVSNIVTVCYFKQEVIDTSAVFRYLDITHIDTPHRYTKNIPNFDVFDAIISLRYGAAGARGVRAPRAQMQNIVSADISIGDIVRPYTDKVVHCKLSSKSCHVTGAKSFEQGERATKIFLGRVMAAQRRVDRLRMEIAPNYSPMYRAYNPEKSFPEISNMCDELLTSEVMLCSRPVEIENIVTANGVYEFKVDFPVVIPIICELSQCLGHAVDHANWRKSSVASVSVLSSSKTFYHRALVNASGSVRLSSSCVEGMSVEGYNAILELLYLSKVTYDQIYDRYNLEDDEEIERQLLFLANEEGIAAIAKPPGVAE